MISSKNCVTQLVTELKEGKLLYRSNVPSERGNMGIIIQMIIVILFLGVCIYLVLRNHDFRESLKYSWFCITTNVLLVIICCLIWRISNLSEELHHVHSRYDNNTGTVFSYALQFNLLSYIIISLCVTSFVGMILIVGNPLRYLWEFGPEPYVSCLISCLLVTRMMNIDESKLDTSLTISRMKGLDYGSGMAYSYFYGYLNIVLPASGDASKGLLENIAVHEAQEGIEIPVKKLFILIPTSMRIPPDLKEVSCNWLESAKALESVVKTRAGVKDRTYHNTVYKLHPGGRDSKNDTSMYVITEGATPLLTFYEVLQHSGKDSTSYDDFKYDILSSFYRTLRYIIKSKPETRNLCELVFYEDVDCDQNVVNVGKILLDRIKSKNEWR